MLQDPFIQTTDADVHLRDARHAHQLYTEHNFALAPKTKFLYHVVFDYYGSISTDIDPSNSRQFSKELGVLVKEIDLPAYSAEVTTKNQYNRKKNVQTRIDYDPISIRFHDDNSGITKFLLQEYYQYYFVDGNKKGQTGEVVDFLPRDKHDNFVPSYGLDNGSVLPFFKNIRIYQLSRQKWVSYTLINPLVTKWGHDSLDNADGSGVMANNMTLVYEGVIYNQGEINGEPVGFADPETRYDNVPSPLGYISSSATGLQNIGPNPKERNVGTTFSNNVPVFRNSNRGQSQSLLNIIRESREPSVPGGIPQIDIPKTNIQDRPTNSRLNRGPNSYDVDYIRNKLDDPNIINSVVRRVVGAGAFTNEWGVNNFTNFGNLTENAKNAFRDEIIERATSGSDRKIQKLASDVIRTVLNRNR